MQAGIIVKKSGERIENVSIISVTETEIVYVPENGIETTILKSDVKAILYDDGRYIEFNEKMNTDSGTSSSNYLYENKETVAINVLAYGKSIMGVYTYEPEYDGITVEYRVITDDNPNPEFTYLGTTPFAYLTDTEAKLLLKKDIKNFTRNEALAVEKGFDKLEFRLSDGQKSVVVKPMVKIDFGGRCVILPLGKLKK